jgi:hypothetical protein
LKVTIVDTGGAATVKLADDGSVAMVNTSPQKIKVLLLAADTEGVIGNYKFYPEFKIDDSWIQCDAVVVPVIDDAIPG